MTVQEKNFYEIADKLFINNQTNEEMSFRCSINRAYYGAFHISKKYLKLPDETTHRNVINLLTRRMNFLGNLLNSLYNSRWESDYDLKCDINKIDAEKILKNANIIITELEKKLKY